MNAAPDFVFYIGLEMSIRNFLVDALDLFGYGFANFLCRGVSP
jgi:hypothetical protein